MFWDSRIPKKVKKCKKSNEKQHFIQILDFDLCAQFFYRKILIFI
jgi:hypothetical protein